MSDFSSKLNGFVFVCICVAAFYYLSQPRVQPGPPDDQWFQENVVARPQPVLVKFGADWCPPCRAMEPELDRVEAALQGKVAVVRINVDEHRELDGSYGVSSIPQVMLFDHGKVLADHVGFVDQKQ